MIDPRVPVFVELTAHHGFERRHQSFGNSAQWYEIIGKGPVEFERASDRADQDWIVRLQGPVLRRFKLDTVLGHLGEPVGGRDDGFMVLARRLETGGLGLLDGLEGEL